MSDPNLMRVGGCCPPYPGLLYRGLRGWGGGVELGPWASSWSTSPSALALIYCFSYRGSQGCLG